MNKNLFRGLSRIVRNKSLASFPLNQFTLKQCFCSADKDKISRRFSYGQGG